MKMLRTALVLALALLAPMLAPETAPAQVRVVATCGSLTPTEPANTNGGYFTVDQNGQQCSSAAVSASITGYAPGASYATVTATNSSADVALPTGAVVVASNTGTTAVSCNLTVGAGTATASKDVIQPGSWFAFTVGSNTHLSCIDQTGSASNVVVLSGGSGLPTGSGGGGSGGGGGAITAASGAFASGSIASGAVAAGAFANGAYAALETAIASTNTKLDTLNATAGAAIPTQAPTVSIGGVGIIDSAGTNVATVKAASTIPAATDKTLVVGLNPGTSVAGTPTGAIVTVQGVASMTPFLTNPGTAANWAIGTVASPSTNVVTTANPAADPCQTQAQTITPFTVATATTQTIVTGTSAKKIYVCYLYMQTGLANNVAVISGTTAGSCAANVAALVGGTTAAAGLINAANSGQAFGNGAASVLKTATNADDICLITSAAGPLAGVIKYVVQ